MGNEQAEIDGLRLLYMLASVIISPKIVLKFLYPI